MKRRRKKHIKTPVGWTLTTGLYEVHFDGNLYDRVRIDGVEFVFESHPKSLTN